MSYTIYVKNIGSQNRSVVSGNGVSSSGSKRREMKARGGTMTSNKQELLSFLPKLATVVAIAKVTDGLISTGLEFYEGYTGNYTEKVTYNNIKSAIGSALRPINTSVNVAKLLMEEHVNNLKAENARVLTGNSIINTYGGYKI